MTLALILFGAGVLWIFVCISNASMHPTPSLLSPVPAYIGLFVAAVGLIGIVIHLGKWAFA